MDSSGGYAARPAFNLDLKSVLFTSAAVGGKIPAASSGGNQGGEAADAIFEIGDYDGSEWKLTLLDNSRNFAVTEEAASGKPGDTITLNYTGATTGTNEYTFGPNAPINREQMAVMMYRYAQYMGYDTTQGGMAIREYADYGQVSSYALEAMDWANATGIVTGTSESTLSPQGQATRAQAAAMFLSLIHI